VILRVEDGRLFFATFVRYDRLPAALVWPPVSLIHRQVALAMVRSATKARQPGADRPRDGSGLHSG
jgi:hypothetical protein